MAVNLKEIFETVGYNITGGEQHGWQDVFPYGRFIDWEGSFSVVFSEKTQKVFSVELYVEDTNEHFMWITPEYRDAYQKKMKQYDVNDEFEEVQTTDVGVVLREYVVQRGKVPTGVVEMDDDFDIAVAPV